MPADNPAPRFWIASELDLRDAKTAATLFTRGGGAVLLNSGCPDYVEDLADVLHGRGSHSNRTLANDLAGTWAGGGGMVFTCGIDDDDRAWLEVDGEDFTIDAGANNAAWGFDTAGHALVGGGGPYRQTGVTDWVRGVIDDAQLIIRPASAPGTPSTVPFSAFRAQSVVTMLRGRGLADADDMNPTENLEKEDNSINSALHEIRWYIDDDGHVVSVWPTALLLADPLWDATAAAVRFRNLLGFTGDEVSTVDGNLQVYRATYPAASMLAPTRGHIATNHGIRQMVHSVELTSGDIATNVVGATYTGSIRFYLDGPADTVDHGEHWLRDVLNTYLPPGGAFSLYQDAGDPRRAIRSREVTTNQAAYGVLSTSEGNGDVGRLRLYRAAGESETSIAYAGGSLRRRYEVTLGFTERPT